MKTKMLRETRLLDYYDGPAVVEAQDEDGRRYLCDVLETCQNGEWFLVVPVSDAQVETLNKGESCLRSVMEIAGRDEWYLSVPQWDFRKPFKVERQDGPIADSPDLPGEGYTLTGAWDD